MIRKGVKPRFVFRMEPAVGAFSKVLPFRRSWVAIIVLAAMDVAFLLPAVFTFRQASGEWSHLDSLFDLVGALFLSAWLLGWSIAPLLMTAVLLMMLFGREVLQAQPGRVDLFVGVPLLSLGAAYESGKMRNLRFERPPPKSGRSWRGGHLAFDYGANTVRFGSGLDGDAALDLSKRIESAAGPVRRGEAVPAELEPAWEPPESEIPDEPPAPAAPAEPLTLASPSSILLVVANLIPVAGTLFFGWRLSDVMVLYWAESAVVGFYNLLKIAVIGRWFALLAGPFFLGHFGGFMAVHFLFIYTIFIEGFGKGGSVSSGDLSEVAALFVSLWPALLALFVSHGYSFFANFIGRGEYHKRTVGNQMSEPYGRIVFMHLVLIFGGGLSLALGDPAPVLLIVIALKIVFDLRAHLKQHDALPGSGKAHTH